MRHIVPISGKDSLAAALVAAAREDLPYKYFFTDTESELPETYAWLTKVEEQTGWKILCVGESLPARIAHYHGFLPGHKTRYCTKECKIEHLLEAVVKTKTVHRTTIVGKCPHGCADVYEAEFHVENRVITVESIQAEIDRATQEPIYQESLTQTLADRLGWQGVTSGMHGRFGTECRAEPERGGE